MHHLDGQVHHDTHALPMGNYVIAVGNYVIVSPSELGNCMIADSQEQGRTADLPHFRPTGAKRCVDLGKRTSPTTKPELR